MNKKILALPTLLLVATLGISATASAESINAQVNISGNTGASSTKADATIKPRGADDMRASGDKRTAVFGTVTAVTGNTITITSKSMDKNATTQVSTTYTINASAAVIDKNQAASTVSAIQVGDNIMAEGKIEGTTVTATKIHNGVMAKGNMGNGPANAIPEGNGQPIVGGTVTAVSGNTITITNKSNVSYTIDATNAKITKSGTTTTVSTIAVGDSLVAQGTINGTSVTAVNIVDSGAMNANASVKTKAGFFGMIGNFFSRLFGKAK